tara:strand:+ start:1314 stop:2219 length:906 start_codon:yes stop_codon:yes gene_type:complete
MFYYKAYGLCISSNLELPVLESQKICTSPSLTVFLNDSIEDEIEDFSFPTSKATSNYALVNRPEVGLFKITSSKIEIKIKTHNLIDLSRVLLGLPLGYFFLLNNFLCLHASAIAKNDSAFIFIGRSGYGKSLLASDLIHKGFRFITEDICVIRNNFVLPSFPMVKFDRNYFPKESKYLSFNDFKFSSDKSDRRGFKVNLNSFSELKGRVHKVYVLNQISSQDNCVLMNKDQGFESVNLIMDSCFKPNPVKFDVDLMKSVMNNVSSFITENRIIRVNFTKNNFEERNKMILEDIDKELETGN